LEFLEGWLLKFYGFPYFKIQIGPLARKHLLPFPALPKNVKIEIECIGKLALI